MTPRSQWLRPAPRAWRMPAPIFPVQFRLTTHSASFNIPFSFSRGGSSLWGWLCGSRSRNSRVVSLGWGY